MRIGRTYVSVVNLALDAAGLPIVLISRLARHTQNLSKDARASLLVSELPAEGDALTGPRMTVLGGFRPTGDPEIREAYVAQHPESRIYVDFPDFSFWRMEPRLVHAVAGFGRIETLMPDEVFGTPRG